MKPIQLPMVSSKVMSIVLDMYIVTWPPVISLPFPYGKCLITNHLYNCQVKLIVLTGVLQCGVLGLEDVLTGVLQINCMCRWRTSYLKAYRPLHIW